MTKFVHIVQVHPVEQGLPNLHKVKFEQEFDTWEEAVHWVNLFNYPATELQAVYLGCVNDETGELV
jgi:hypothetical protein